MKYAPVILLAILGIAAVCQARPQKQDDPNKKGSIKYGVKEDRGGARPFVEGRHTLFQNKNTKAEVYGHWERTYKGPNHGDRSHGGGVVVEHSWGKR